MEGACTNATNAGGMIMMLFSSWDRLNVLGATRHTPPLMRILFLAWHYHAII